MKITYSARNINCKNCANTIKNALEDEFGNIEVNLDKKPCEVTLILNSEIDEKKFKTEMEDIGFPIIEEISRT